ncbi:putative oxidoreductase [Wickerhamomyces ciferrii]|uniref:Oxidoreductase n=1 Tax=Wickerhamomyces ciferrii (strain ATCC 14091 / BCRC 22168 / CBS 111 / JCM 3599 / NBRC 0793 / NRRL Y-1031 F-60-10) TaxID=1206466 RepID=K0KKW3_WICCF|nr:putative oxidoreductase [Wickerhamomyces ciferrii]CCH45850.1 putative oxidoreductase [Wickerhamomyces ciferrii]
MSATLVTGANGFIAGHIVKELLQLGINVVGSVRSFNKAANLISVFPNEFKSGQLKFVEVDFNNKQEIESIFTKFPEINNVIHPAQNFGRNATTPEEYDKEIIQYTKNSIESIVDIVEKSSNKIERFVYFSSSIAVRGPNYDHEYVFTEQDFANLSHEDAIQSSLNAYTYAKVHAEKFILNQKSLKGIEYKIIVPPTVIGPPLYIWDNNESFDANNKHFYDVFKGKEPKRGVEWYADVRSIAKGAVKAADKRSTPSIENNRYVIVDGTENYYDSIPILLENFQNFNPGNWDELNFKGKTLNEDRKLAKRDLSISEKELGLKQIQYETTVIDTIKLIIKLDEQVSK